MKATLKLENIGGRVGIQELDFKSGVVTLIKGRTAAGKSRIIKSYALALSFPIHSDDLMEEAINFGILKSIDAEYLPLVNSSKDKASIELKYNGIVKKVDLFRDGKIKINENGNHKFLYCSMLVKNSRIHNHITRGNADFKWIVDEMSLAKDYEIILRSINNKLEELTNKKEIIEKNRKIIKEKTGEIEEELVKKAEFEKQLKVKVKQIDDFEFDEALVRREDDIQSKKTSSKKVLTNQLKIEKISKEKLEELAKNINVDKKVKELRGNIKEKGDEANTLKIIEVESLQKDIIKIQGLKSQEEQEMVRYETRKQLWETVKIEEGNKCPLCQSVGKITEEDKVSNIEECNTKIEEYRAIIKEFSKEINEKQNKINSKHGLKKLEDEIVNLVNKLEKVERSLKESEEAIMPEQKKHEKILKEIELNKQEINKLETELIKIQEDKKKDEQYQILINEKSDIDQKVGGIREKIKKSEELIKKSNIIELFKLKVHDLNNASIIIEEFEEIFKEVNNHLDFKIKEQREGAAKKFNKSIKNLIKELKFYTFKEIYLDLEEYRLKIIDNNDDSQELSSVSGGEKSIISSLLQISAKETYLSEIPFLIGDEIILDLDPERSDIFLNYLKKIAEEKDWFIILTQITNQDLKIIEI